uniref:Putative secreted protein n=1 Tax=Anopheles darlingi TaxID=43151 RepID=A0A2M4D362_ANODA
MCAPFCACLCVCGFVSVRARILCVCVTPRMMVIGRSVRSLGNTNSTVPFGASKTQSVNMCNLQNATFTFHACCNHRYL